jgi:hypothetical protein
MGFNFRTKQPLRTYGLEWAAIPFSFVPNASDSTANPTAANIFGPVSVSFAGTGLYNVALVGGCPRAIMGGLVCETALKGLFQVDCANVNSTNGTFQIRAYTFATTTLINFTATTSVQKVHGVIYQQLSSFTR